MHTITLLPFALAAFVAAKQHHTSSSSHRSLGGTHPSSHVTAVKPTLKPTSIQYDPLTAHALGGEGLLERDGLDSEDKRSASSDAIRAWEKAHGGQPVNYQAIPSAGTPDVQGHYFEPRAADNEGHIADKSREELDKYYANLAARWASSPPTPSAVSPTTTASRSHTRAHTHTGTHTRPSTGSWTHKPSVTHTHSPISGDPWQAGPHNHGPHEHHSRSAKELNAELLHQAMPHDPHIEHLHKRSLNEYYTYLSARSIPEFPEHDEVDTSLAGYPVPNDNADGAHEHYARSAQELNADLLSQSIPPHPHLDHPDNPSLEEYYAYLSTHSVPDFPEHDEIDTSLAGYHVPYDHVIPVPAAAAPIITPAPVLKVRGLKSYWETLKSDEQHAG
ncbi:hypothetical protein LTR78_006852 [Recurvomyces mirabilis]|uniref:Uncharacterized protein n=1 Tax=Recurvomyces mirabilis TaxID=574656 RepID=A0AAE0WKC2_9PEZI|nr:hypothetical protein LTR78_006852 [Recurvomyces mirabilis]KAK5153157.1 hypothetical protein LTS14_007802 [Recurvomyces mirabilis]